MATDFLDRSDAIEECYEFMLAYAGQGVPGEAGEDGSQIHRFLDRAATALDGLVESCSGALTQAGVDSLDKYQRFLAVLDRDSRSSLAAIEMVLAQPVISSQLIDNLNASIHLRALLTDLFLISEIISARDRVTSGAK
ncbi:MAG TPA: hypothetical protein VGL74_06130 [Terriglobales bacterium]